MVRKISHIIVSVLLLIASTGFTIYKHYCGEDLMAESILTEQEDCCDTAQSCCHEEAETIKIDVEYLSTSFDNSFKHIAVETFSLLGSSFNNPDIGANSICLSDHQAPLHTSKKVQSYLQVFLL
ncbi:MAG: hypothetical protein E4H10_10320 [Bacteroidia bacterium]|nr:MAG: hypothetical protein E4H10_10320 [Bacteroidia bacterium]